MNLTLSNLLGTLKSTFKVNKFTLDTSGLTAARTVTAPDKSGTLAMISDVGGLTLGTAQATTSGTSFEFATIPSGTKRVFVVLNDISTNGTSNVILRLGDSGGIEDSGYVGLGVLAGGSNVALSVSFTSGLPLSSQGWGASFTLSGTAEFTNVSGNIWVGKCVLTRSDAYLQVATTTKTLSGALDRVMLTTVGGTDSFDAGSVNILYE
jgi:hypothetical protein